MMRKETWENDLCNYLESMAATEHQYGVADCGLFGAGGVFAMTGLDPAALFRGKYSTAQGSIRALKKYGAGTLEATIDALFPAIPAGFAQRGDLVWNGAAVGICAGATGLFMGEENGRRGLVTVGRARWAKAWRVE